MVNRLFPIFLALAIGFLAQEACCGVRLYGVAAGGEADRQTANDLGGSGGLFQGGLSLEAASPYALAFLQPWLAWYGQGPAFEAVAGAAIGLPIPWINGHAWLAAEASLHSVNVPVYPGREPGQLGSVDVGGTVLRRESGSAFGPSFRLDAWRGFGALTFLSDAYPMWRIELGYRLMAW